MTNLSILNVNCHIYDVSMTFIDLNKEDEFSFPHEQPSILEAPNDGQDFTVECDETDLETLIIEDYFTRIFDI